jgi:hypothetical protein
MATNVLAAVKTATKDQIYEALWWLFYSVAAATLPIWLGGYVLLRLFGRSFNWIEYAQHGEFALYSIVFLLPIARLVARDGERAPSFPGRQFFSFVGWMLLATAVAVYSAVISASQASVRVNLAFLFVFSVSLFGASVVLSFLVTMIDALRLPQVGVLSDQQFSRLEDKFERTPTTRPGLDVGEAQEGLGGVAEEVEEAPGGDQQPGMPEEHDG